MHSEASANQPRLLNGDCPDAYSLDYYVAGALHKTRLKRGTVHDKTVAIPASPWPHKGSVAIDRFLILQMILLWICAMSLNSFEFRAQ
jgi:hypothetical protein